MAEPKITTSYLTFNVGVRYAIALCEAVAQATGKPTDIQEAIKYYFFDNPKDIKLWAESLFLAVNVQREVDGLEQMSHVEFMAIADRMGLQVLAEHFALLAKTFTDLNSKNETTILEKKKKFIGLRFTSFLSFRGK